MQDPPLQTKPAQQLPFGLAIVHTQALSWDLHATGVGVLFDPGGSGVGVGIIPNVGLGVGLFLGALGCGVGVGIIPKVGTGVAVGSPSPVYVTAASLEPLPLLHPFWRMEALAVTRYESPGGI